MDGNEAFDSTKGGIANICNECSLYEPFTHQHGTSKLKNTHIRGSTQIDFILCSYNTLFNSQKKLNDWVQ